MECSQFSFRTSNMPFYALSFQFGAPRCHHLLEFLFIPKRVWVAVTTGSQREHGNHIGYKIIFQSPCRCDVETAATSRIPLGQQEVRDLPALPRITGRAACINRFMLFGAHFDVSNSMGSHRSIPLSKLRKIAIH